MNTRIIEIWAMLALQCSPRLHNSDIKKLITYYGSASHSIEALQSSMEAWFVVGITPSQIYSFLSQQWKEKAIYLWKKIQAYPNIEVLLISDPIYPALLKEIPDPPPILYYQGNINIASTCNISIVGTRKSSPQGKTITKELCANLVQHNFSIISGLAEGIDAVAHESALETSGKTLAVLGNGVDITYPAIHKKLYKRIAEQGCLLSEFPPQSPPKSNHFPIRNRLISGLSLGIVVIEAGIHSGTMLTVKSALEQGRNVYTISPQYLTASSTGNEYLISEGATPISSAQDIIKDISPQLESFKPQNLAYYLSDEYQGFFDFPHKEHLDIILSAFQASPASYKAIKTTHTRQKEQELQQMKRVQAQPQKTKKNTPPQQHIPHYQQDIHAVTQNTFAQGLSSIGEQIMTILHETSHVTIDYLIQATALEAQQISSELIVLEIQGLIHKHAGNYYSLSYK